MRISPHRRVRIKRGNSRGALLALCCACMLLAGLGLPAQPSPAGAAPSLPTAITRHSQPESQPTEILIKLRDNSLPTPATDDIACRDELAHTPVSDSGIRVLSYPDAESAQRALNHLRHDPGVAVAELNVARYLSWVPDDADFVEQQWWLEQVDAPAAWEMTQGTEQVVVAVIDSGVSPTHPDLINRLVPGYNAVDGTDNWHDMDGHGTHVAGIIAAQGSNEVGTAGVAMDVRIMPIRVMADDGSIDVGSVIDAIYWAVDNGADIINLSFGSEDYVQLEREAIQYAYDRGVVVIAASGNEIDTLSYPAQYPETISVGALNSSGLPSEFTSRVTRVDLAAPGESIYSPGWDPFYGDYWDDVFYSDFFPVSGTSFSAPIVAGAAALIKSVQPGAGVEAVRTHLTATALDTGDTGNEAGTGAGQLDVEAAVRQAVFTAMQGVWYTADSPVASGAASRSWLWGAGPVEYAYEPYADALHGTRLVYYYDKSRMEATEPTADRANSWYVTNGLLVTELITGRLQLGDNLFESRSAADVNVAGDPNDAIGPLYSSFSGLLDAEPIAEGETIVQTIGRSGVVGSDFKKYVNYGVVGAAWIPETNHRVADVFWDYLNASGTVATPDGLVEGQLFDPWYYATGFPITEAYWARVKLAGVYRDVLIQCFERRCLTYTPDNAPGWQVEMGNVGRHYYAWRYNDPLAGAPPPNAAPAVSNGGVADSNGARDLLRVRPRDRGGLLP